MTKQDMDRIDMIAKLLSTMSAESRRDAAKLMGRKRFNEEIAATVAESIVDPEIAIIWATNKEAAK